MVIYTSILSALTDEQRFHLSAKVNPPPSLTNVGRFLVLFVLLGSLDAHGTLDLGDLRMHGGLVWVCVDCARNSGRCVRWHD